MTPEEATLDAVKGIIDVMNSDTREKIYKCADVLRAIIAEYGEYGGMALALIGAEVAAEYQKPAHAPGKWRDAREIDGVLGDEIE